MFRNSPAPLFLVERKGLDEVFLETPDMYGQERASFAWCWKYRVAPLIENPEQYDKILFVDCDSLALRNIDHLLEGEWDIRYQPERGKPMNGKSFNAFLTEEEMAVAASRDGANSGTLAVRGSIFHEVMEEWQAIDAGDVRTGDGSGFLARMWFGCRTRIEESQNAVRIELSFRRNGQSAMMSGAPVQLRQ